MGSIDLGEVLHLVLHYEIEHMFLFVRHVTLRTWVEALVTGRANLPGISHLTHVDYAAISKIFLYAQVIFEIVPGYPFRIQVANLSDLLVLLKNTRSSPGPGL